MSEVDLAGRRVLIREDLNVPIDGARVTSDTRIRACLPTIEQALSAGAKVLVISHLGRPTEGEFDAGFSLAPVAARMGELLGRPVRLERDWLGGVTFEDAEVVLGENVRFNRGEAENDDALAKQMAALCDVFVMDAFGTAHRAQASTHGVAKFAPTACAGPLLTAELDALGRALENPARPMIAIVGGAKVSTKLQVLDALSRRIDRLIVGGGIANTFIAASGHRVGKSLFEPDLVTTARQLAAAVSSRGAEIPVPSDVVVGTELSAQAPARVKPVAEIGDDEMILDIGPQTALRLGEIIAQAKTIVWNGPMGVFEYDQFGGGTRAVAAAIAASDAFSLAGGGETLAAIDKYGVADQVSYISTGGGAFLEFLEGKTLPAVAILETRARG